MKSKRLNKLVLIEASLAALSLANTADAADAVGSPPDTIVVSAEKRATRLQDTPAAITLVDSQSLDARNIVSVDDLNGRVPGLSITQSESFQRLVSIRGVGYSTPQNSSVQPGVAFHLDGVYIAGSTAIAQDMFDTRQIEVLRGPQGTIYGQNSEGGTINVITNKPELGKWSGSADFAYGTYNLIEPRAMINVPLGDNAAIRITGMHYQHDGFAKSAYGQYDLDNANQDGIRGQFLWKPGPQTSILLSGQYFDVNQNDAALKNINDPTPGARLLAQDYPGKYASKQAVIALTLKQELGFATISSISSYQYLSYVMNIDNDRLDFAHYTPHDLMPHSGQGQRSYTQEFNITSRPGGKLDWIAGAFYLRQRSSGCVVEYYATTVESMPIVCSQNDPYPADLGYQSVSLGRRDSWSLYGQATYHLAENLRVTGGLRFTHDDISSLNSSYFSDFTRVGVVDKAVTGKLGLEIDVSRANMFYASYTRGSKPGGANLSTTPLLSGTTFKPEFVNAFEAGLKNSFADGQVTLNAAAFYYDYHNYQYAEDDPIPYQGGIANAGRARIYGAEAELAASLPHGFSINGNVTALSGKVRSHTASLDSAAATSASNAAAAQGYGGFTSYTIAQRAAAEQDLYGKTLPFLSPVSFSLGLTKAFDVGGAQTLKLRADYRYQGHFQARIFNVANLDTVGGYGLLDLSASYAPHGSRWNFQIVASNVTNSDAVASKFTNTFGFATTSDIYVKPRQVLGRIGYSF